LTVKLDNDNSQTSKSWCRSARKKDLFWEQSHEDGIDPIDLHRPVHERPHAVVIADRDRKREGQGKLRRAPD